ncbi:uncharacterized protein BO66DRAFT_434034 [Aspergillus aculeatinus CBS 121060]|uniref:Uncharacterized protein n=1 Tax=Aspergillus aculeatinus CBS 121060 TaxID=1448322 RepID=A0ACD1HN99_9EURO|nr:hypothetical protein BO66DRAFT_434034 [Aspergillus aculeatinus CBS 121060]RAH74926.1 hypothetical protein BO66DRAFT_434034 [Aspergillus aculeatinus CBS 121060]
MDLGIYLTYATFVSILSSCIFLVYEAYELVAYLPATRPTYDTLAIWNSLSQNPLTISSPLQFGHEKIKQRRKGHGAYQITSLRLLELHTQIRSEYGHHFLAIAVAGHCFSSSQLKRARLDDDDAECTACARETETQRLLLPLSRHYSSGTQDFEHFSSRIFEMAKKNLKNDPPSFLSSIQVLPPDIRGVEQTLYSWNVIGGALQTIHLILH